MNNSFQSVLVLLMFVLVADIVHRALLDNIKTPRLLYLIKTLPG